MRYIYVRIIEAAVTSRSKPKDVKGIYAKASLAGFDIETMVRPCNADGRVGWDETHFLCCLAPNGEICADAPALELSVWECLSMLKTNKVLAKVVIPLSQIPVIHTEQEVELEGQWYYPDAAPAAVHSPTRGTGICAAVFFDEAFEATKQPVVGQLSISTIAVTLTKGAQHFLVLHWEKQWVRLPPTHQKDVFQLHGDVEFEVSNPATCLTVAVFDAEAHGARHEHDFLGLVRVGASVLPIGEWVEARLPLYVRKPSQFGLQVAIVQTGDMTIRLRRDHPNLRALYNTYRDPVMPMRHYGPVFNNCRPSILRQRHQLLSAYLSRPPIGLPEDAAQVVFQAGGERFHVGEARVHLRRVIDAVDGLMHLRQGCIDIWRWKSAWRSIAANALWVGFVYEPLLGTAFCLAGLVASLVAGRLLRRPPVVELITMDPSLFELGRGDEDEPDPAAPSPDGQQTEATPDEKLKQRLAKGFSHQLVSINPFHVFRAKTAGVTAGGLKTQSNFDGFATFIERIDALFCWHDPVASLLVTVALGSVCLWLLLFPGTVRPVLALGGLFAMRPPFLRRKKTPLVVNFFAHLPCRTDRLVPDSGD